MSPNSQIQTLETFVRLQNVNARIHAFRSAIEIGLLDALRQGPGEAAEIAERAGTQARPTELLLDALCQLGVVQRFSDDFILAPVMQMVNENNLDLGDHYWNQLSHFVRTGESIAQTQQDKADAAYRADAMSNQWLMTPAAMSAADALDIGSQRCGLNVLDVGAGSAVWSMCVAHRDPGCHVTVVDVHDAVQRAMETAESVGVRQRVAFKVGDYREINLGDQLYDLAIVAGVFQLHTAAETTRLLARIRGALRLSAVSTKCLSKQIGCRRLRGFRDRH